MRSLVIASALSVSATAAFANDTQQYDFDDFTKIEASAGILVTIETGQDFHVEAEAIRGKLRRLEISQSGDTLDIDRRTSWGLFSLGRRDKFEVTITVPDLEAAKASSGSTVTISGPVLGDLDLDASSGAHLAFDGQFSGDLNAQASSGSSISAKEIQAVNVVADSSSGSTLTLSGTCEVIEAESSSGASVSAADLLCREGEARSSSGASLSVFTDNEITAKSSGGASLTVFGSPTVADTSSSGGASISIR